MMTFGKDLERLLSDAIDAANFEFPKALYLGLDTGSGETSYEGYARQKIPVGPEGFILFPDGSIRNAQRIVFPEVRGHVILRGFFIADDNDVVWARGSFLRRTIDIFPPVVPAFEIGAISIDEEGCHDVPGILEFARVWVRKVFGL